MSEQQKPTDETALPTAKDNVDRVLDASAKRQQQLNESERRKSADKAAKMALITAVIKKLAQRGLVDAFSTWQHLSLSGMTPRPASQDEFRHLISEMTFTNQLAMTNGNPDSPLNKIYLRALEYRID